VGFRFYRRVRLFPGVSMNLSRSGPSLSLGVRGAHVTFGRRGVTKTVGIPGTGVFYTSRQGYHTGVHSAAVPAAGLPAAIDSRLPQQTARRRSAAPALFLVLLLILAGVAAFLSQ
jgi:hypothetical protein